MFFLKATGGASVRRVRGAGLGQIRERRRRRRRPEREVEAGRPLPPGADQRLHVEQGLQRGCGPGDLVAVGEGGEVVGEGVALGGGGEDDLFFFEFERFFVEIFLRILWS